MHVEQYYHKFSTEFSKALEKEKKTESCRHVNALSVYHKYPLFLPFSIFFTLSVVPFFAFASAFAFRTIN